MDNEQEYMVWRIIQSPTLVTKLCNVIFAVSEADSEVPVDNPVFTRQLMAGNLKRLHLKVDFAPKSDIRLLNYLKAAILCDFSKSDPLVISVRPI
jgi:hypothetical protein